VDEPAHQKVSVNRPKRSMWTAMIVGVMTLCVAACGSSAGDAAGTTATARTPADSPASGSSSSAPAASGYPLTVKTKYGPVTIDKAPTRVVALGVPAADALLSLGVTPVAVAADPSTLQAAYPWMVDSIKDIADAKLMSQSGELNVEAIAQTHPDPLIAQTWQLTDKAVYDQLSKIAPTVAPDSTALNVDWDQRLLSTAAAVDKTAEAEDMIAKIKAEFAAVGESVPDISSKTYQFVRVDPDGFGFGNGSVLGLFGLKPAANQDNTQNGPPLSKENTSQLNADLLGVWAPTQQLRDGLDKDPLFQSLPAVQNGTIFYADLAVADAANEPAPMALQWLKDKLVPVIEKLG
jgi:iron complex transport system substrate-binding protein